MDEQELQRLMVRLVGDNKDFLRMVQEASAAARQAEHQLLQSATGMSQSVNMLGGQFQSLIDKGRGMAAIAASVIGIGGSFQMLSKSISLASELEDNEVAFETFLKSGEKAKKLVADISEFASKTPLSQRDVQAGAKMLLQFGFEAESLIPTMRMLGDATGGNADALMRVARQYGQVKSQGKAMGEEINVMIEAGFNPLKELEKMGHGSMASLMRMRSEGKITFAMLEEAFKHATEQGGDFYKMMENKSKTLSGLFSTMKDDIDIALAKIGKTLIDNLELKWLLKQVSEVTQAFQEWFNGLSEGTRKVIIFTVVSVIGLAVIAAGWYAVGVAITYATAGLNLLVGAIVVVVAAAMGSWIAKMGTLQKAWKVIVENAIHFYNWVKPLLPMLAAILAITQPWVAVLALVVLYWDDIVDAVEEFWQEVQPIARYLRQAFLNTMTEIRDFMVAEWRHMVAMFKVAVEQIQKLWSQVGGSIAIDWKAAKTALLDFMFGVDFAFNHMRKVADFAWTSIKYGAVVLVNALLRNVFYGGLVAMFPALLIGVFVDWKTLWTAVKDWTISWGENIHAFFKELFSGLLVGSVLIAKEIWIAITEFREPDIKAIIGKAFVAVANAAKAINDNVKLDFRGIEVKGLVDLEAKLKQQWEAEKAQLNMSFDEFKKMRMEALQIAPQQQDELQNKAEKAGEGIGKGQNKGLQGELKKFDAAIINSAEGIFRIMQWQQEMAKVPKPTFVSPMPHMVGLPLVPEPPKWLLEMQQNLEIQNGRKFPNAEGFAPAIAPMHRAVQQGGAPMEDMGREITILLLSKMAGSLERIEKRPGVILMPAEVDS